MRFKKLVETILTEDIESMKKYYPNISDEDFQSYIELDPTYKEGSNQAGKYAKWILGLANKGKLDNIGHVKDVLSRFDEEKNNLKEKDIMKYKSVDEVEAVLNDENSYKALSDRQRLRQTQKAVHNTDLDQDAERLFNGKDWEVWTPHTYEASCKLGRGTQWCTASTESDHYFRSYTKSGKLYIIINKHNGEKYQFHFESASFMDAKDESIPIAKFLLDNRELNDYFYAILPDEVKEQVENLKELADNDYVFVYHGDIPQKMKYVFRYIEKIIVERDITKIPDKEFHKLIGLKEVSLHDNITYIGESAFEDCENLEYINLPHNLEHLGDYAFDGCVRLKSIKINSELQMLPMFAFSYTDAKRVDVPGNINVIGNGAFCNTNLQTVVLNEGVQVISSHAFSGSDRLTNIKLPHSLNKIDSRAFRNCTSLQKIVIPKEVEYMGHRVFGNCPNLTVYCEAEEQPIRWETDWNHGAEVVWGYKGDMGESYKMRFKLDEGKNLEQTVQQYIDKYKKIVPAADDELHRNQVMGLIAIDPTYKEGSTTTGDYAIWILNMAIKNGWDVIGARDKLLPLLTDFIDKKSQLPNKDINSYKSAEDLEVALKNCTLTDRQKERKARNASSKTKKVLETDNWEVYAALNWEGALTLGKGTSWCTATSDNASWYAKYISDIWWDDDWDAFEVRDHAKNHLSEDEIIDMVKNSHISDIEPTTIDDIYANYSDRAVFLTVNNDTTFLVNPYEQVPVEICNTLYVFVRKGYPSERYQFCMSYDLQEIEDDYYNAITFCDASDRAISFDDFVEREPELKAFWTETLGQRLTDLLGDDEEEIEESYSMRFTLTEDIAAVRKNYPKISDEDFDRLIKLDPTYREGSNSVGTYGKWILNLFNKGNLDNEGHVFDILTRFEENKKNLKNKDIGKFKTLEELDDYLNDEDNYKSLSNRQVTRQNQNARRNADLGNEAEKVFDGSNWEVWVPKTYAASCKLGQGSSWCTATTSSEYYYNYYTHQGNLYININKHDDEDKYQFHFETGSFMDINDRPIVLSDFLSENDELHNFYYPLIAKSIGVEIGGADYDLELDFNGGAFARVLDYWGENFANRDYSVSADFIRQILTGDSYDLFYYDGMMTIRDSNDLPYISNPVREELKRLGLEIDDLWAIVDEEIEDEEGNTIPYADEILDAVDQATMDAVIVGTEDEAISDIEKAMTIADGEGYIFTIDQGSLILSASPETLVDAYLEMSDGEIPDILRDSSSIAADILVERWASTFRCYEPQYGWNGFSDDAFNEALADRLSEITK